MIISQHNRLSFFLFVLIAAAAIGCHETNPNLMSPLGVGAQAPEILATGWINGTPDSTAGKVVVVDCWAHW